MSSAGSPAEPPRASVFISYASEDRAAARELRDALTEAGLDVWYDEKELGGGDAWDQKIRRQIRECDYFMPVISATTERRKEGYFRREWRLAAERTLDMADDVLFLLPVVIDETTETAARVPEKFFAVQWLRVPDGKRTPALDALAQRLLAGDHTPMPRSRGGAHAMMGASRTVPPLPVTAAPFAPPAPLPPASAPPPLTDSDRAPPPMPAFPHAPEGGAGNWVRFVAEVLWWFVTATWVIVTRLPRWLRIVLAIWVVFMLISTCSRSGKPPSRPRPSERAAQFTKADREEIENVVKAATDQVRAAFEKSGREAPPDGAQGKRRSRGSTDGAAFGKPLVLVPFGRDAGETPEAARFAAAVFVACSDKLMGARRDGIGITQPAPGGSTDDALVALSRGLSAAHIMGARITGSGASRTLSVRLIRSADGAVVWNGTYPVETGHAAEVGTAIAEAVLAALPAASAKPNP